MWIQLDDFLPLVVAWSVARCPTLATSRHSTRRTNGSLDARPSPLAVGDAEWLADGFESPGWTNRTPEGFFLVWRQKAFHKTICGVVEFVQIPPGCRYAVEELAIPW